VCGKVYSTYIHPHLPGDHVRQRNLTFALLASLFVSAGASSLFAQAQAESDFQGWQTMRVIQQEGYPLRTASATLDASGRQTLIVVNTRQSRLELYTWLPADKREKAKALDADRPNELPMAPEFKRTELTLDQLPADALPCDIDSDGKAELVVLTGPAPRIAIYRQNPDKPGGWAKAETFDLLPGVLANSKKAILLRRPDPKGPYELLISFNDGIQTLTLKKGERAKWLTPRDRKGRFWWDTANLRGNSTGSNDIVEVPSQPGRALIRWFPSQNGQLLPAIPLGDDSSPTVDILKANGAADEIIAVDPKTPGILKRYRLSQGESSPIGDKLTLPLPNGASGNFTGLTVDSKPSVIWIDPDQPMLRLARLSPGGWESDESFPGVTNMLSLEPIPGQSGVLILARDASELLESKFESGRLSYPKPVLLTPVAAGKEGQARKILALGSTGDLLWWAQKIGDDLAVYRWAKGKDKPDIETFPGIAAKIDSVLPYAPGKALVKEQYAQGLKALSLQEDGKPVLTEPSHLSRADLASYQLINVNGAIKLARVTDGVLQWIGADLQPTDQIMLADGQKLSSYVPLPDGSAWALQSDGIFLHLMKPDKAGVPRIAESYRVGQGAALLQDPVLGLILIDSDKITRLAKGPSAELALVDSFDARDSRPAGKNEPGFTRIATARITRPDKDNVLLFNDEKHEVTLLDATDKGFKAVLTWQVFDDSSYPYGGGGGERGGRGSPEPRSVTAFDADGDGLQDLAILCHDRLLLYLARDKK
jgi:hypothetical protein